MPTYPAATRPRRRIFLRRVVLLGALAVILRTWCVEGLFVPCRIVSGSMATTLLGWHRNVVCKNCGLQFPCAADLQPAKPRAVCPNCDYADNNLEASPTLSGDGVLISKSLYRFRPPRRWEIAAFRRREDSGKILVKRIVGLPGESVRIRQGDLYVNGNIQRKNLAQQRALAVAVYDASFRPTIDPAESSRWRGVGQKSQWGAAGGLFAHPAAAPGEPIDWLIYRHLRRTAGQEGRFEETPITDRCGYNQTRPRRLEEVQPVTDLMLSLRVIRMTEEFGPGQLMIRITDGVEEFLVRLDPSGNRYEVLQDDRPIPAPAAIGKLPPWHHALWVEVSVFDRQFILAFGGRPVFTWWYDPSKRAAEPTSRPVAIGSKGLEVAIRDLRLYRDVYYTRPMAPQGRWGLDNPVHLAADQYYVLGDNSPVSQDSRVWAEGPAVDAKLLLGKPFLVHFPPRLVRIGPWKFQVPDPAKIRYIR